MGQRGAYPYGRYARGAPRLIVYIFGRVVPISKREQYFRDANRVVTVSFSTLWPWRPQRRTAGKLCVEVLRVVGGGWQNVSSLQRQGKVQVNKRAAHESTLFTKTQDGSLEAVTALEVLAVFASCEGAVVGGGAMIDHQQILRFLCLGVVH